MGEFNVLNLSNISEPAAGVVKHVVDKIANAIGWVVTPKNIKPAVIEANKSIIAEIANRQDIPPHQRIFFVNHYSQMMKEHMNQTEVLQIAAKYFEPTCSPQQVSDDWIVFFFDKVKNVTEDDMKEIWGRILAGEFNMPNSYSKQFLHTMSVMDSDLAERFQKIRSSCFYSDPRLYLFMYRTNGNNIINTKKYEKLGIYISDLRELDGLGLIQYRFTDFHTLAIDNKVFDYGKKRIRFETDQRSIALGNVALTSAGKQLCRIAPMRYDDDILDICLDAWTQLGYHPVVEYIEEDRDE